MFFNLLILDVLHCDSREADCAKCNHRRLHGCRHRLGDEIRSIAGTGTTLRTQGTRAHIPNA